jgi:hypothetical protein
MTKGATVIVSLALVWGAGCGTNSAIGNLHTGGAGGNDGIGGSGGGLGGHDGVGGSGIGGSGIGGDFGVGGSGVGGSGTGGKGTGGAFMGHYPGECPGSVTPVGTAKSLTFAVPVDYPTGAGAFAVATGDLNGDGKLDLVLLDHTAGARLMFNNGDGTFTSPSDKSVGSSPIAVALGDIDGDGRLDIVSITVQGEVVVVLNQGGASFAPPVNYIVGTASLALALGDLNGDGKLDIVVADEGTSPGTAAGDVGVLLNTGGETFVATNYPASRQPAAIAIADLDNDCQQDVVVVGADGVSVLANNGLGGLLAPANFANGTSGTSVVVRDVNGDGMLDLVEGTDSVNYDARAYVLLNRGNALFNAPVAYALTPTTPGTMPSSASAGHGVALADMNADGRPDLLDVGTCCGLGVFLNRGDGTFAPPVNFATAPSPYWIATGDLNGDHQDDVAVVSTDGVSRSGLRVLMNASH